MDSTPLARSKHSLESPLPLERSLKTSYPDDSWRVKRSFDALSAPTEIEESVNAVGRIEQFPLRLEQGILKKRKPLKATMISEDLPLWVLGMKCNDWESFNSLEHETASRPEVHAALDRLSSKQRFYLNQNSLIGQSHLTDIALIVGSPKFLLAVLPLLPKALPLVIHCERRSRRDPLPDKLGIVWTRISHACVGGVTNQHIWVGI
jgi:hypothetical protein